MALSETPADPGAAARAAFIAPETRFVELRAPLPLELGGELPGVRVAYRSWGRLAPAGDNAVVVCHALTGSADADRWWTGMFGPGRALDPEQDFIVCSNILGSCYGTTGPVSLDPATGRPWLGDFPLVTIRDMVRAQRELLRALGVTRVRLVVGGSLGGMQVLEWALTFPELVEAIAPIATSARHSAWAIGLSEAQRQAIYADPRWRGGRYDLADPPAGGLSAARTMAMCTYRHKGSFEERFGRRLQAAGLFAMESYLRYQGRQFVERFDAASYVALTRAMDTHDVARGRGDFDEVLRSVRCPALVVSIDSDVLYLPEEQEEIARGIPGARLLRLASRDGHDAFLIDVDWLSGAVAEFRGRAPARRAPIRSPSRPAVEGGERPEVSLFVLGKGKVGGELLDQIARQLPTLERDYDVALRVVGLADRRRTLVDEGGVDLARWRELLAAAPETGPFGPATARPALERLARAALPVLVDVTAADGMEQVYAEAFRRGVHVVGANKRPLVVPWGAREALVAGRRQAHRHWRYETTVGASLPVLDTLRGLVRAGDRVRRVEGSLSGTLGFVTSELTKGFPLSLVVRWARELGHTEEDPRDDLSGLDAARKAVILARELGVAAEVADVAVEPLVPREALPGGSLQELYEGLRRHDAGFAARCAALRDRGLVLRYVARLDLSGDRPALSVGPVEVPASHRAASLQGVEAYVAFTTDRHADLPLLVQGAGVGGALTAGGLLSEIFEVAAGHGAR
ncbi:homoserine O-acetyltransferase MetX [Anaeromyxobacter diazotrophicus]|nr:homoserine O-acetyltransferase [Anaeromyxobacter diazotrophicus]